MQRGKLKIVLAQKANLMKVEVGVVGKFMRTSPFRGWS